MSNGISAWSYSRYSDYKQCPLKFKLKYLDKMPTAGSPAMDRGNLLHKAGEDFVTAPRKPAKLPVEFQHFKQELAHLRENKAHVEMPWGFREDWSWTGKPDWFGSDVWFRMKADAAVTYDDNTGLVVDWKSGRKYHDHEDQGMLFGAVAFMRFPQLTEVDVRFWYLDLKPEEHELQFSITAAEAVLIRKDWAKKAVPMFKDKRFAPTPNDKCKWCDFAKNRGGPCKFSGG